MTLTIFRVGIVYYFIFLLVRIFSSSYFFYDDTYANLVSPLFLKEDFQQPPLSLLSCPDYIHA